MAESANARNRRIPPDERPNIEPRTLRPTSPFDEALSELHEVALSFQAHGVLVGTGAVNTYTRPGAESFPDGPWIVVVEPTEGIDQFRDTVAAMHLPFEITDDHVGVTYDANDVLSIPLFERARRDSRAYVDSGAPIAALTPGELIAIEFAATRSSDPARLAGNPVVQRVLELTDFTNPLDLLDAYRQHVSPEDLDSGTHGPNLDGSEDELDKRLRERPDDGYFRELVDETPDDDHLEGFEKEDPRGQTLW
jgi:hypothetical protein